MAHRITKEDLPQGPTRDRKLLERNSTVGQQLSRRIKMSTGKRYMIEAAHAPLVNAARLIGQDRREVQQTHVAQVQPMAREIEIRPRPLCHAKHIAVEVAQAQKLGAAAAYREVVESEHDGSATRSCVVRHGPVPAEGLR